MSPVVATDAAHWATTTGSRVSAKTSTLIVWPSTRFCRVVTDAGATASGLGTTSIGANPTLPWSVPTYITQSPGASPQWTGCGEVNVSSTVRVTRPSAGAGRTTIPSPARRTPGILGHGADAGVRSGEPRSVIPGGTR